MNKTYPILYARDSLGKVRTWQLEQKGNAYCSIAGTQDGLKVSSEFTTVYGKNIGKANETSDVEQATKEVLAKYKDQESTGYHKSIEDIDEEQYFQPQLAKKYEDYVEDIDWAKGLYVSGKLDGLRCVL